MNTQLMRNFMNVLTETQNYYSSKVDKQDADYTDIGRGGEKCKNCTHFIRPNRCQIVEGTISPFGWCRYFEEER